MAEEWNGLTARELAVAASLYQGKSLDYIRDAQGLTRGGLDAVLQSAYGKTGTRTPDALGAWYRARVEGRPGS